MYIVSDRELSWATKATRAKNNTKAAKYTQTTKTRKGKESFICSKITAFT